MQHLESLNKVSVFVRLRHVFVRFFVELLLYLKIISIDHVIFTRGVNQDSLWHFIGIDHAIYTRGVNQDSLWHLIILHQVNTNINSLLRLSNLFFFFLLILVGFLAALTCTTFVVNICSSSLGSCYSNLIVHFSE